MFVERRKQKLPVIYERRGRCTLKRADEALSTSIDRLAAVSRRAMP
jgi:hypothetical protein